MRRRERRGEEGRDGGRQRGTEGGRERRKGVERDGGRKRETETGRERQISPANVPV